MTAAAFTTTARQLIHDRDAWRCLGCSYSSPLTVQHRRARGMGGSHDPRLASLPNGMTLCGSGTTGCHGWVEDHPTSGRLLGWVLDAHQDPAATPAYVRDGMSGLCQWRRFNEDGSWSYVDGPDPRPFAGWREPRPVEGRPWTAPQHLGTADDLTALPLALSLLGIA